MPNEDETEEEIDYGGCMAIGVAGMHSEEYGEDQGCRWCGEVAPSVLAARSEAEIEKQDRQWRDSFTLGLDRRKAAGAAASTEDWAAKLAGDSVAAGESEYVSAPRRLDRTWAERAARERDECGPGVVRPFVKEWARQTFVSDEVWRLGMNTDERYLLLPLLDDERFFEALFGWVGHGDAKMHELLEQAEKRYARLAAEAAQWREGLSAGNGSTAVAPHLFDKLYAELTLEEALERLKYRETEVGFAVLQAHQEAERRFEVMRYFIVLWKKALLLDPKLEVWMDACTFDLMQMLREHELGRCEECGRDEVPLDSKKDTVSGNVRRACVWGCEEAEQAAFVKRIIEEDGAMVRAGKDLDKEPSV